MSTLKIQTGKDNQILRTRAKELSDLSKKTENLNLNMGDFILEMKKDLEKEKGLGLAAPQVGESIRVCLCRFNVDTSNEILAVLINPEITWKSWDGEGQVVKKGEKLTAPLGAQIGEEGCLSLPNYWVNVLRANKITVTFYDGRPLLKKKKLKSVKDLDKLTLNLSELNARVVQHETDHLNGILICDKAVL
jgi:peptide deformylase